MKLFSRDSLFSFSVIISALIIGVSIIQAARIITESAKSKEVDILLKSVSELDRMLKEKEAVLPKGAVEKKKTEAVGSRKVEGVGIGSNPIKGNVNAPVLMVEFSDFQCPYSKKFYQQVFPLIEKEYISSGKVKFAYRDLPLGFHSMARPAAIAARCAGKQGKYWQMFDKIISSGSLDNEALKKYAQELGLNMKAYEDCLSKDEFKGALDIDIKDAAKFGVSGTPGFFINGRFVNGAYPFETFKKIIEEELAKGAKNN